MKYLSAAQMLIWVAVLMVGCGLSNDPQRIIAKAQEYRSKNDYKAAAIELKNLLQKNVSNAEARFLLGVTYYDSRDYRSAEQELRRALDLSYERSKVMPVLGKSMVMLGEFQKVLDQIPLETHANNVVQADILTVRARALMGLKQGSQAQELLAAALVKQPEFADALVELARLAVGDQKLDDSGRLIERAIASSPRHVDAWLVKGDLARIRVDSEGAMAAYQKVLEFDHTNIWARPNIVSLHIAAKKLDDARKVIADARRIDSGNFLLFHLQALVDFLSRDYKSANDAIQQVLKVAPDNMPSVLLAGAILSELGAHEQAQMNIRRVLEVAPGNIPARKLLVSTLVRSGQMRTAIEVLQPALKQAPEDAKLMMLAGELYLHSNDFAKAVEYFDKAAKRDPKSAVARTNLGISRMWLGDTDRAFADLESAVDLDSTKYQTDMVLVVSHLMRGNYDQALRVMDSLEKKQPNNPVTFNLKGVIYLGKKDIPNARKSFERALEMQPTFLAAAISLAQLDLQDKNPKGARGRLYLILEKDKGNAQALLVLAELGPALGATQHERLEWLERARKVNPRSVQPQLLLSQLYNQMGDMKKALEVAQQAHASSPENPHLLDFLGAAQVHGGQIEEALATYRKLVDLQPKSPAALYQLARIQILSADYTKAKETLRRALSIKPDFVEAQAVLVSMEVRANRFAEAINIVRQIQKQNPKAHVGFDLEGDVLMAERKFPEAIKVYEAVLVMVNNSAASIKLHLAYTAAGKADEGDLRMAKWLKENPDDFAMRFYVAESSLKRGQYKDAIAHYEWLQQRQPDNILVVNNLAWAYSQVKDARALEFAERAYKLAPNDPSAVDTLGWLLVEQGNAARGIELLQTAVKVAPKNPVFGYHLALGWSKAGDKSRARAELERVIATDIAFPEKTEALNLLKQLGK